MAKILVVDTSLTMVELFSFTLTSHGHEVVRAISLSEALSMFTEDVDLVVASDKLQDGTGYDLVCLLSEARQGLIKVIILIDGLDDPSFQEHKCPYLVRSKPINYQRLVSDVTMMLG